METFTVSNVCVPVYLYTYLQRGYHPKVTHSLRITLIDRVWVKCGQSVAPMSIRKTIHHYSSAGAYAILPYYFND